MYTINVGIIFPSDPGCGTALDLVEWMTTFCQSYDGVSACYSIDREFSDIEDSCSRNKVNMDLIYELQRGE